jgi:hypothetical protein
VTRDVTCSAAISLAATARPSNTDVKKWVERARRARDAMLVSKAPNLHGLAGGAMERVDAQPVTA